MVRVTMRTMLLPCAVLLLFWSEATIAEPHVETMEIRMEKMEKAVSAITEELAENRKLFKDFVEALLEKNTDTADKTSIEMVRRQINLDAVLSEARRDQLSNLFRNTNISAEGLITLLKGEAGMPGAPGEPGPPGPPGYCSKSDCRGLAPIRKVWSQENVNSYIRVTNLPALTELTACFYFAPKWDNMIDALRTNSSKLSQHLMSIASPANDNAFLIWLYKPKDRPPYMTLGGEPEKITAGLDAFKEHHRHCFTWKSGSYLKWFYDVEKPGILKLAGKIPSKGKHSITAGSALVPLHDQDVVGGSLDRDQMTPGTIADFQMWDRALSDQEVQALGCNEKGSLVTFDDFDTVGLGKFYQGGDFQCTDST